MKIYALKRSSKTHPSPLENNLIIVLCDCNCLVMILLHKVPAPNATYESLDDNQELYYRTLLYKIIYHICNNSQNCHFRPWFGCGLIIPGHNLETQFCTRILKDGKRSVEKYSVTKAYSSTVANFIDLRPDSRLWLQSVFWWNYPDLDVLTWHIMKLL